jgi:DNA-binding NtrC family response regulator
MPSKQALQEDAMDPMLNDCILIVDGNLNFRERLAQEFRSANYKVLTTSTGEEAFFILRRRSHQIGWFYSRAVLAGLIDGWILADEYREIHPDRPAVISAHDARFTARGDIVLREPTVDVVSETMRDVSESLRQGQQTMAAGLSGRRHAA